MIARVHSTTQNMAFCLNTGNHRNHINSAVKSKRSAPLTTRAVLVSFHKQHVCLIVSV